MSSAFSVAHAVRYSPTNAARHHGSTVPILNAHPYLPAGGSQPSEEGDHLPQPELEIPAKNVMTIALANNPSVQLYPLRGFLQELIAIWLRYEYTRFK